MKPGQLVISFFIAAIITIVFAGFFRTTGPWKGFWIFFLIMFFVALAASEWVTPIGSSIWGYYWIPGLFVALIFAILIAAITPKGPQKERHQKEEEAHKPFTPPVFYSPRTEGEEGKIYKGDEHASTAALGGFFWIFILLLILVVWLGIFID